MSWTYGVSANDVLTDAQGRPTEEAWIAVTDPDGRTVTGLVGLDGTDLDDGWVRTDAQGRYGFTTEAGPVLQLTWQNRSWPVVAVEQAVEAITAIADVSSQYRTAIEAAQTAETAERLAATTGDAVALADEADAQIATIGAQSCTLDELYATIYLPSWTNASGTYPNVSGAGAGVAQTVCIAPFALRVHHISFAWEYWGIAASNSQYWEIGANREHWTGDTRTTELLAISNTGLSGDGARGAVTPRQPWGLPLDGDIIFSAGDLLTVGFRPQGNPPDMYFAANVTVSYSPA